MIVYDLRYNVFISQSFVKRKFTVVKVLSLLDSLDLLFYVTQAIVCYLGSVGNAIFGSFGLRHS